MKFSGKIWFMIILKVTKKQGFTLSSEDTFLEKPQGVGGQDRFRVLELNWNKILWNNKVVTTGKSPFFVIDLFCTLFCTEMLRFQSWSWTKKRYSSFLKKVYVFQKICFKIKVLKTFKISSDFHINACRSVKRRAILKILSAVF